MDEELLLLDRPAVAASLRSMDPCAVVEEILRQHATGRTMLPSEGYLPWTNGAGAACRAFAMLGAVAGEGGPVFGMKLISASLSNPAHGRERAGGLSFLFDPHTARPRVIAEAGFLSAVRTAAYTMVSLRRLGPRSWDAVALIGCGTLARAHLDLLARTHPNVTDVHLHDVVPGRAQALADWVKERHCGLAPHLHGSARDAVGAAPVVVTVTTGDRGYIRADWLAPGSFVAHVSLDDLLPEVFFAAQGLFVDDIGLVQDNPRRILGRLMRDAAVVRPGDGGSGAGARALDGTLGEVLTGQCAAIRPTSGFVVSNPFGMAVLDVGLVDAVHRAAVQLGLGKRLKLL